MTTEEKLQHFLDTCMEDAHSRANRMLDEYQTALEQTFQEHQEDVRRRAAMQIRQETERAGRELNKKLSIEQLDLKRELGNKNNELKDKLFVEIKDMLANFLETTEYQHLLEHQITEAIRFAGKDEITIYLDPADQDKLQRLALHHGNAEFKISEYSFFGGCRAVIPSRHILIDHSFQTKLQEERDKFHFDLKLTEEEALND